MDQEYEKLVAEREAKTAEEVKIILGRTQYPYTAEKARRDVNRLKEITSEFWQVERAIKGEAALGNMKCEIKSVDNSVIETLKSLGYTIIRGHNNYMVYWRE